ncbi:hypothetical protein PG993_013703 [Apiospora rasikravindrae]|uniref:Uncharacterized protein n=1 Tax=Apiospora rasikravindrae TaxID=990691 RepID=A0ABR1RRC0_9PEZI
MIPHDPTDDAASGGHDLVHPDEQKPLKPKRGPDKKPRKRHRSGQLTLIVIYKWVPSLSGKTVLPTDEMPGIWHLQRSLEDDAMLEADICHELLVGSDHTRSNEDYLAYLGCLTRSIKRLRREIRSIGSGSGPVMLSDSALMTSYVLAISNTPVEEEPIRTGLFGDPILTFDEYRSSGRLKAFFESTHFAQVRSLTMQSPKGMKVPDLLSHVLLLYASHQLIPPGYAFPADQLLTVAQGVQSCRRLVAAVADALLTVADADLLYAVHCMRVICRLSEARDDVLGAAKFACLRTYIGVMQHQLLNIRRADPAIEIFRLGALLFAYGAIAYVVAPDCLLLLAESLVDALNAPRYTEGQPPELLFWAAMLGAMASAPKPGVVIKPTDRVAVNGLRTSRYLITKVGSLARILCLKSWEEAKVILKDFIWAGHVCDKGAKYIWELANPVGALNVV